MRKYLSLLFILILSLVLASCGQQTKWELDQFTIIIDSEGYITSIQDHQYGDELLPDGERSPLMQIRINEEYYEPINFYPHEKENEYLLEFQGDIAANIRIENKEAYLKLELLEISGNEDIDLIVWGPYKSIISETIGETVGVVRDSVHAFGIQALNLKTLGGYPYDESDIDRAYDIFETNDLVDVADSVKVLYRGRTAEKREYGSVIQAYCRNRNKERIIQNWNHDYYVAPAYDDGGITGSSIALFVCNPDDALETIGRIEIDEGLPHPVIDGEWGKTVRSATASYLIMNFGERSLDIAMDLTKKAGLKYLYHGGPFLNWGHFDLNEHEFPDNWESMKRCVDWAADEGIRLGVHTLSNFITTSDPYVSPVPDPRLAKVGTSELLNDIGPTQKDIVIKDPKFFNQMKNNTLRGVRIENELVTYKKVSDSEPWTLIDCERGAFGTAVSSHKAGTKASKLMDHGYRTFLTNTELSVEVAERIADLFNKTGLRQISFDGLEGNWSTGMGQYGRQLFTQTWYDNLLPENQGKVITDASNPGHFFWHMYTRMNWGEPWYAGFRESQTQYRLLNQSYYRRNLMPSMLGWFRMTPQISLEDIEWLLARAAGFDAGFALVTSPAVVDQHGMGKKILASIKSWETARMAGAFPDEIKKEMEDISNEYHLEDAGPGRWNLYKAMHVKGDFKNAPKQPGEPKSLNFEFNNPNPEQAVQFTFSSGKEGEIINITIEIDGEGKVIIPLHLPAEHHLRYTGGSYVTLFDETWHEIDRARVIQNQLMLYQGERKISIDADFREAPADAAFHVEFRTLGVPINLKKTEK